MIKKTSEGFKVTSESGKNLSAPDLTKAEAEKRLRQVEFFKHRSDASMFDRVADAAKRGRK